MRQFARITSAPRWSAVWMTVIVGSLCFSTGEGLRLTLFPVTEHSQVEETNGLASATVKYRPLAIPTSIQKRSKRQATDFDVSPPAGGVQDVTITSQVPADQPIQLRSVLFMSRPAGRAPPRVS